MTVGAPVPLTGRYAAQGAQVRAGLELWARFAGAALAIEDDGSRPERAVAAYSTLLDRCELVLGPYGSDSVRAVARSGFAPPLWNHGGAADDVQMVPGVVSVPSPASRYLVALARAVARLRPRCSVAVATARGGFARLAREGLEREAGALGLARLDAFALDDPAELLTASSPDAVLLCGPVEQELPPLRALRGIVPLLGGVSPGLQGFPTLFGEDPGVILAPVQWHPDLGGAPELGPATAQVLEEGRALGLPPIDYIAAQAFACALIAAHCWQAAPEAPLRVARALRTTTLFGAFALDPDTGIQRDHRLCVVRWRGGRQELLLADAA
jgi:ABC-type branched-subunit amino acid transport system substrate-binding protein